MSIENIVNQKYNAGFVTNVESEVLQKGLNEKVIRIISQKNNEPDWLLNFRLRAFARLLKIQQPKWPSFHIHNIDLQDIRYFSQPKNRPKSLDEVDPEILADFQKLGIPLKEQAALAGVAVDAVFDSVSLGTTYKEKLAEQGIIFGSFNEAVQLCPEIIKKYLGTVVPINDNYWTCLNSAVFSDGSFVYIPKGVRCPLELSTYFRINERETGQFERTLIIAEENSYVSYLEGCTAPMRDENQLHAAVVELVTMDNAEIKYSTIQNWYPGNEKGQGGIYNFVTKRGLCKGKNSKISWTQVETGSAITWKYPSCILRGDNSIGEFYSVALTNNHQVADTGTKMIHIGKNTKSTIISKGISAGNSSNAYRGLVRVTEDAKKSRNFTQCDSLLLGNKCAAITIPYIENTRNDAIIEHEATSSKLSEDQLFYLSTRGLDMEKASTLLVNGFCKEVFNKLPLEFAAEANKLLEVQLEGSIG